MEQARNFGFLLSEVSRKYVQRFEKHAHNMSLTLPTCKVLASLQRNEGVSQSKLAELTRIEPMAIVRILDRMQADGLVERRSDPGDRRAHCLYLLPASKPVLDEIWRIADLTRKETCAGVDHDDLGVFLSVLEQLARNLAALEHLGADAPMDIPPGMQTKGPPAGKHRVGSRAPKRTAR